MTKPDKVEKDQTWTLPVYEGSIIAELTIEKVIGTTAYGKTKDGRAFACGVQRLQNQGTLKK